MEKTKHVFFPQKKSPTFPYRTWSQIKTGGASNQAMSDDESRHEHLPTEGGEIFVENGSETVE